MPHPTTPQSSSPRIPDFVDEEEEHSQQLLPTVNNEITEKPSRRRRYLEDSWVIICKDILITLLPSFIQPSAPSAKPVSQKVYKTGWLDGLRGIASLIVMIHHSSWLWYPELSKGYGSCPDCYHIVQLPILRLFYSGSPMVAIFFVVLGFSLSHKALSLIRKESADVLESLSSSTFRRGIRLVLPPIAVTFIMMLLSYYGWYPEGSGRTPPRLSTFWQSLHFWFDQTLCIADIFRPVFYAGVAFAAYIPVYEPNLWTIDIEFHGSLAVFLTLLGVSKLQPIARILILAAIPLWLLYFVHTYLFLFLSGVFLAELHQLREDRLSTNPRELHTLEPPPYTKSRFPTSVLTKATAWSTFWPINFIIALYTLSMPLLDQGSANTPGYRTLVSLIPEQYLHTYIHDHFWIYIAAVHLVFTIDNAQFLQSIFLTSFAKYMGKIGFALYLVHGTILYTIGCRVDARGSWLGPVKVILLWMLAFWCADLVWRGIDAKSVSFARWLYGKVSVGRT